MKAIILKAEQRKSRQQPKQFLPKLNYFLLLWPAKGKLVMSIQHKIIIKKTATNTYIMQEKEQF